MTRQMTMVGFLQAQNCNQIAELRGATRIAPERIRCRRITNQEIGRS